MQSLNLQWRLAFEKESSERGMLLLWHREHVHWWSVEMDSKQKSSVEWRRTNREHFIRDDTHIWCVAAPTMTNEGNHSSLPATSTREALEAALGQGRPLDEMLRINGKQMCKLTSTDWRLDTNRKRKWNTALAERWRRMMFVKMAGDSLEFPPFLSSQRQVNTDYVKGHPLGSEVAAVLISTQQITFVKHTSKTSYNNTAANRAFIRAHHRSCIIPSSSSGRRCCHTAGHGPGVWASLTKQKHSHPGLRSEAPSGLRENSSELW